MHNLWINRLFAGLGAWFFVTQTSLEIFVSLIFILSVSHTLLAIYHSRNRAHAVAEKGAAQSWAFAALIGASAVCIYFDSPTMYYLILFHHVLNETFTSSENDAFRSKTFQGLFILFEIALFVSCSPDEFNQLFFYLPLRLKLAFLVVGFVLLALNSSRLHSDKNFKPAFFAFIGFGFIGGLFSLTVQPLNIDFLIFYHFLFWLSYPALKGFSLTKKMQWHYVVQTSVLAALALPLTLLVKTPISLNVDQMSHVTRILAYFHIFSTLALSASNPKFIRNFFGSRPRHTEVFHEKSKIQSAV